MFVSSPLDRASTILALCDLRTLGLVRHLDNISSNRLFFLEGTARFKLVSIQTRCFWKMQRCVARDMFLGKSPLAQRGPLSVQQGNLA